MKPYPSGGLAIEAYLLHLGAPASVARAARDHYDRIDGTAAVFDVGWEEVGEEPPTVFGDMTQDEFDPDLGDR